MDKKLSKNVNKHFETLKTSKHVTTFFCYNTVYSKHIYSLENFVLNKNRNVVEFESYLRTIVVINAE